MISWSDNCCAQNTCWMILFFHAFLVKQKFFKKITLKLFKKGHTFSICDTFYGVIENSSYGINCYETQDWCNIMNNICSVEAKLMPQKSFKNWSFLNSFFKKQKMDINDVEISDIRGFYKYQLVEANKQILLRLKMNSKDDWRTLNITKSFGNFEIKDLYNEKIEINLQKVIITFLKSL